MLVGASLPTASQSPATGARRCWRLAVRPPPCRPTRFAGASCISSNTGELSAIVEALLRLLGQRQLAEPWARDRARTQAAGLDLRAHSAAGGVPAEGELRARRAGRPPLEA
eukprot:7843923-Pyramimonas_sp.AAC.1